jgi:hypothetical protein
MILPKALMLGAQLMIPIAAGDGVPNLNVEPVCKGIAEQGGVTFRDPAVPEEKKKCIESELAVREQLVKEWSSFSAGDRKHCINETTMGGESSYTELLTCLEMARDVRAMRAEEASSRAGATRGPSSPSTVQPAPAEPASRPTSANVPPKLEVDTAPKEWAKADAQNATASEALAKRKLADAQATLQRTKEEAERATNEAQRAKAALQQTKQEAERATNEAQRAKADAQAARESEATAKRKLADAEAARTAAEGRCQSAAKSQPGLGARLRKWFEPKN